MTPREQKHSLSALCKALGKGPTYVRRLQRELKLHVPDAREGYSDAYLNFFEKLVALRTFNVPVSDIADLFVKERRILEMLHFHSLTDSPTWYLDACGAPTHSDAALLLTGHNLGSPVTARAIQANLDFSDRNRELFQGVEMGEDVRRALDLYVELLNRIRARIRTETIVLRNALAWSARAFE